MIPTHVSVELANVSNVKMDTFWTIITSVKLLQKIAKSSVSKLVNVHHAISILSLLMVLVSHNLSKTLPSTSTVNNNKLMEHVHNVENITNFKMEIVSQQVKTLNVECGTKTKQSVTVVTIEIFSTWTIMESVQERTKIVWKSILKMVNAHHVMKDIL